MAEPLTRGAAALAALLALSACAGRSPPSADDPQPPPPAMTGAAVMLLPVQSPPPALAGLTDEVVFWLAEEGPAARWVGPATLRRAARAAPEWNPPLDALPLVLYEGGAYGRIGADVHSDLRRLGAVLDVRYALIPAQAALVQRADGVRVEITALLVDTIGGHVVWRGIAAGEVGRAGERRLAISAARALARILAPL